MNNLIKAITLIIFLCAPALAAYQPEEMCVIPWGDSANQLKIGIPNYEDVNFTPADSNDDFVGTTGPSQGFVDKNENSYLASHDFMQLKGFEAILILSLIIPRETEIYIPIYIRTELTKIYIDSISRIYVLDGMRYDYVAVVDTTVIS